MDLVSRIQNVRKDRSSTSIGSGCLGCDLWSKCVCPFFFDGNVLFNFLESKLSPLFKDLLLVHIVGTMSFHTDTGPAHSIRIICEHEHSCHGGRKGAIQLVLQI